MKEAIFIVIVVLILFALTAVRYRKQIAGVIGLAKVLKEAKDNVGQNRSIQGEKQASVQLVNCAKCGVWVPQNKVIKQRNGFYCSNCQ